MRALIACAGCLAHGVPIPLPLLYAATASGQSPEIEAALERLIHLGFLHRLDKEHVLVSRDGHRFLAGRERSDRSRDAVELAVLITANRLLEAKDFAGMAALEKHLAVVDAALPRADDKAVMLAGTFLLCLLHLEAVDTLRNFLPHLQALETATGLSIIPAGLVERLTGRGRSAVPVTQPMFTVLQSIAGLDDRQPVPLSLLHAAYGPPSAIERTVAELVARDYLAQPDAVAVILTEAGRRLQQPVEPAVRAAMVPGLVKVVKSACDQENKVSLRRVKPQLQQMTGTALPQADETAHHLLLTLVQSLMALDELLLAATYIDQAEELEAALGLSDSETTAVVMAEKDIQYHTQVAVYYSQQHQFGRARQHFARAITLADDSELLPLLHQKLGDCCGEPGDEPGQIEAYVAALNQALAHYGRDSC